MRARESGLWQWLRGAEKHFGDRLHWQRIENSIARGTPDVEGVCGGHGFVLELKSVGRRSDGTVLCELSSDQAMFLRARRRAGGTAYVLIQVGVGAHGRLYMIFGEDSDKLLRPIPEEDLHDMSCISTEASPVEVVNQCL